MKQRGGGGEPRARAQPTQSRRKLKDEDEPAQVSLLCPAAQVETELWRKLLQKLQRSVAPCWKPPICCWPLMSWSRGTRCRERQRSSRQPLFIPNRDRHTAAEASGLRAERGHGGALWVLVPVLKMFIHVSDQLKLAEQKRLFSPCLSVMRNGMWPF